MKIQRVHALLIAFILVSFEGQAQSSYFKADNSLSLDQASSWTNNNGNTPQATDWAVWDANVATTANCTNENLGASATWGAIKILNPAGAITITNSTKTLTLAGINGEGIDMNETGSAANLYLNVPVTVSAPQTWDIKSGLTLTLGVGSSQAALIMQADLAVNGALQVNGKDFRISNGSTLYLTNDAASVQFLADAPMSVGYNGNGLSGNGAVTQSGGVVVLKRTSTSKGDLLIGTGGGFFQTGTYNLNGGSIMDTNTPSSNFIMVGDGTGFTGVFNIDGGNVITPAIQIGNSGTGILNLTNGTVTTTGGDFQVSKGGSSQGGTLNVYGGVISIQGNHNLIVGKSASASGQAVVFQNGGAVNISGNLQLPATTGFSQPATVTIADGAMTVTNNVVLADNGILNLNGGQLTANSISVLSGANTAATALNLNGGTLTARGNNGNFISTNVPAYVMAGGAVIDSAGFSVTAAAPLLNGTGGAQDGGLTKLGGGTLTLTSANIYTGPTIIGGGALDLTTTNFAGGATVVSNAATLHVALANAGDTVNVSSLTLGGGPSDNTTVEFDLGSLGKPTVPIIHATNLVANGTITFNIFAADDLLPGVIPLIHYDTASGAPVVKLNFAQGVGGYITNDTTSGTVELVAQILPTVVWRARVNTNWDTVTLNWVSSVDDSIVAYANGGGVQFDDSASNSLVNITAPFLPTSVLVSNSVLDYTFAGSGKVTGSTGLIKEGAGALTLALTNANDYAGDTVISNGSVRLGVAEQIPNGAGKGDVMLDGKLDLAGFNETINGLNGNNGVIDNSGVTAVTLAVGANGDGGTFAGTITNSGASLTLSKTSGSLALLANNAYSGGTINGSGELTLGSEKSIGSGPLALNGGTLDWTDAAAHTLTNALTIGGNVTLGSATNANGTLTISGTVNLGGGNRTITCNEDVLMPAGATNGSIGTKDGPATLVLKNTTETIPGSPLTVKNGIWIMDNDTILENGSNIRLQCTVDNGLAGVVVTNGAALILTNTGSANLRVGATDVSGGAGCTNFLDIAGLVRVIPTGTSDALLLGGSSSAQDAEDHVNLLPSGVLEVHQIKNTGTGSTITAFNFNGGTLRVNLDDFAATFMQGLTAANVLDGGAFIDTAGYSVTIGQSLQSGGSGTGGLTKLGAGTLYLAGASTYGGPTTVSAGMLSGNGSVTSPVNVASGASIGAGTSTAPGTFTISSSLTLSNGGSAVLRINSDSLTSDLLAGMAAVNYGGTLVVSNMGTTPLPVGTSFTLFSASAYHGSFTAYNLASPGPDLGWDTSRLGVDGSIKVISAPSVPAFSSITLQNGNVVINGTNGTAGQQYSVLVSTNLALPLSSWTPIYTNQFSPGGEFSFTNSTTAAPQLFFNIQSQ